MKKIILIALITFINLNISAQEKKHYENGNLQSEYNYDTSGKKNGECKDFFEDGTLSRITIYKNGLKINTIQYHPNGQISESGKYLNGKEDGEWIAYYDNGNIHMSGVFKEGKEFGEWKHFYRNGNLKELDYNGTNEPTKKIEYYENGNKSTVWINGEDFRVSQDFYLSGEIFSITTYRKGTTNDVNYFPKREIVNQDKIIEYSKSILYSISLNDADMLYTNFINKAIYKTTNQQMKYIPINDITNVVSRYSKLMYISSPSALKYIIINEANYKNNGEIDLIYTDSNGKYFSFHYLKYINLKNEVYFTFGNDDFHNVNINETLNNVKLSPKLQVIQVN